MYQSAFSNAFTYLKQPDPSTGVAPQSTLNKPVLPQTVLSGFFLYRCNFRYVYVRHPPFVSSVLLILCTSSFFHFSLPVCFLVALSLIPFTQQSVAAAHCALSAMLINQSIVLQITLSSVFPNPPNTFNCV